MTLNKSLFEFLNALSLHNNREWFEQNKGTYQMELSRFRVFCDELCFLMESFDLLEGKNIFRIYRDVRFSKDKSPYKTHFGVGFTRATKWRRGGYYLHLQPGASFIGGGFWAPEAADLKRIRQELAVNTDTWNQITQTAGFRNLFGEIKGEKLKSAPQAFPKNHAHIQLLKLKQFLLMRNVSDEEVFSDSFLKMVADTFRHMLPFFDYFSEILTTDENGTPLPGYEAP
jgi:uncharacterized protein (TIGR02453 family)